MATKRRPPPKKQPSPPTPPHSDGEDDEDLRSSSEEETEVKQDRNPLISEASDEDDSESEPEQVAPNPPGPRATAATGDEEDDDGDTDESGEEEEESEEEEEQSNPSSKKSNVARPAEANGNPSDEKSLPVSESEEDDSESEEVPTNPSPRSSAVTHPSDKKAVHVSHSEEDDSESEEETPNPSPRNAAIADGSPLDLKSVPASDSGKVAATPLKAATVETAKKLFQRIWSDEDQIALLQGMVDYVGTKGKDPVANIEDFWSFIRKKMSFSVTQSQLMTKIRNVRGKYKSRSNKGKERPFSKPYEAEVFELSKKVWGASKNGENGVVKKGKNDENGGGKKRKNVPLDEEDVRDIPSNKLLAGMPWDNDVINLCKQHFGCDEYSAMARINSMEESVWKSLLPRWKQLKMEEIRCFENRRSLESETLETIFNSS